MIKGVRVNLSDDGRGFSKSIEAVVCASNDRGSVFDVCSADDLKIHRGRYDEVKEKVENVVMP